MRRVRRGRYAGRSGGRADRSGARGLARGGATEPCRTGHSGSSRTGAAAPPSPGSVRRPRPGPGRTRRGAGAGRRVRATRTEPDPEPARAAAAWMSGDCAGIESLHATARIRLGPSRSSAPPSATFRTKALVVPGVGEGAPGRRSRARNRTGSTVVGHRGPGKPGTDCTCSRRCWPRPAPARSGPDAVRPDDVRRAVREGREGNLVIFVVDASGFDGGARPDGRGRRGHAVAAARCLPAPRQSRGHHVPGSRHTYCCRRRHRCTSPGAGWPGSTPAEDAAGPRPASRARSRGAGEGPRPGPACAGGGAHRWAGHRRPRPAGPRRRAPRACWSPRAPRPSWWTARRPIVRLGLADSWPSIWERLRCAWPAAGRRADPAGHDQTDHAA